MVCSRWGRAHSHRFDRLAQISAEQLIIGHRHHLSQPQSKHFFGSKTDFGFSDVDQEQKEHLVKEVFSRVAEKYDIMNDVMSFGTHRLWKDDLVSMLGYKDAAAVNSSVIPRHLDVAGGTGDVAFRSLRELKKYYGASISSEGRDSSRLDDSDLDSKQIVVLDINPEMLKVGMQRAKKLLSKDEQSMVGVMIHLHNEI